MKMTKREKKYIMRKKTDNTKLSNIYIPIKEYFALKEWAKESSTKLNEIVLWGK